MSLICVKGKFCLQGHTKCIATTLCQRYASHTTVTDLRNTQKITYAETAKQRIRLQLKSSIKVPKKKSWSSTAVLEALENTVGSETIPSHDYAGSPHYLGVSPADRKDRLLAYGKGAQAAEYVIKNHPQYFIHDFDAEDVNVWLADDTSSKAVTALPLLEDTLQGDEAQEEDSEEAALPVGIELLAKNIDQKKIDSAMSTFKQLMEKEVKIPDDLKNRFLGFITFFRGDPKLPMEFEDRPSKALISFRPETEQSPSYEEIISLFSDPTPDQYCTMIRGLVLRNKWKEASAIYTENMQGSKNDLPMDLDTFNSLLSCINPRMIQDLCKDMERRGIRPNHRTFIIYAGIKGWHLSSPENVKIHLEKILKEMEYVGLEPCIGVFSSMYRNVITAKSVDDKEPYLSAILDCMEEISFRFHDPNDAQALAYMMTTKLTSLDTAKRLYKLAKFGKNAKLFRNTQQLSQFHQSYLSILMEGETNMENIWLAYNEIVPAVCVLPFRLLERLMDTIMKFKQPEYLPVIYADNLYDTKQYKLQIHWWRLALELAEDADADTKTQFKNIVPTAMSSLIRCESLQDRNTILNQCIEMSCIVGDYQHLHSTLDDVINHHSRAQIRESTLKKCQQYETNDNKLKQTVEKLSTMVHSSSRADADRTRQTRR